MNDLNPTAIVFWMLGASLGWLADGTHGAVVGLAGCLAVTLLVTAVSRR
jgi:hypothetical protein